MHERKTLRITWQRLLINGQTCPRCGATESEVVKAVDTLTQVLAPLAIDVALEKKELAVEEFKRDTFQSNMIQLNGRLLEDWLGAETGKSECCDVCGPNDCRTIQVHGTVYETITADLIIKAGLLVAAQLHGPNGCDCLPVAVGPGSGCCIK